MGLNENLTVTSNSCGVSLLRNFTGTFTTAQGTFRDNYFMCGNVAACGGGGSCTLLATQGYQVDAVTVSPTFTLTYTCSNVTISP